MGSTAVGRYRGHEFEGRMLSRLLNLTDEQKAKVKEIMEASRPKIKAIREEERRRSGPWSMKRASRSGRFSLPPNRRFSTMPRNSAKTPENLGEESNALRQEKGEDETN